MRTFCFAAWTASTVSGASCATEGVMTISEMGREKIDVASTERERIYGANRSESVTFPKSLALCITSNRTSQNLHVTL